MGFKDELKREFRNLMRDAEKVAEKTWVVDYQGHQIEIVNRLMEEHLIIDGKKVDSNVRKSIWSHVFPYSTLSGFLETRGGKRERISVKLGGWKHLNCIVKVGGKKVFTDTKEISFLPWEHKEKIVPFITRQLEIHHKIVDYTLPDEDYIYGEGEERLEPGLFDQYVDATPTPFFAKKLLKKFEEQIHNPNEKTRKATYEEIIFDHIVSYQDDFIEKFKEANLEEHLVQNEANWLLENAGHREVVKFALTVLGLTKCDQYKDLIFTIGLHDEFTPYAIFALKNGTTNGNEQIFQLAKTLHGWGKVEAIRELDATTKEMKRWLLTEGHKSPKVGDALAYLCAEKGELDIALDEEVISKELYDGAGCIITGLLKEDDGYLEIDGYEYASRVLTRFVYHAKNHCQKLVDFYPLMKIQEYLEADEEVWKEERYMKQWKPFEREALLEELHPFIADPKWKNLAFETLEKDFDRKALEICRFYDMDITSILFRHLDKNPTNMALYDAIVRTGDKKNILDLVKFVETRFSLSNPSNEEQKCIEKILDGLYDNEGVGLELLKASLKSGQVYLQIKVLDILEYWSPSNWYDAEFAEMIDEVARQSKNKESRQRAKQLMETK